MTAPACPFCHPSDNICFGCSKDVEPLPLGDGTWQVRGSPRVAAGPRVVITGVTHIAPPDTDCGASYTVAFSADDAPAVATIGGNPAWRLLRFGPPCDDQPKGFFIMFLIRPNRLLEGIYFAPRVPSPRLIITPMMSLTEKNWRHELNISLPHPPREDLFSAERTGAEALATNVMTALEAHLDTTAEKTPAERGLYADVFN